MTIWPKTSRLQYCNIIQSIFFLAIIVSCISTFIVYKCNFVWRQGSQIFISVLLCNLYLSTEFLIMMMLAWLQYCELPGQQSYIHRGPHLVTGSNFEGAADCQQCWRNFKINYDSPNIGFINLLVIIKLHMFWLPEEFHDSISV